MGFLLKAEYPGKAALVVDLAEGGHLVIGRANQASLRIPEDLEISRLHAEVLVENGQLVVRRNPESTNPIYHQGRACEEFLVKAGESFTIGKTKFTFLAAAAPPGANPAPPGAGFGIPPAPKPGAASFPPGPAPWEEPGGPGPAVPPAVPRNHVELMTMSAKDLYKMEAAGAKLDLSHLLEVPELLRGRNRTDFFAHIAKLLRGATDGTWACIVTEEGRVLGQDTVQGADVYHPSRTLVRKACTESPQPTVYSWSKPQGELATVQAGLDWAVCAAARIPNEPSVVFYVTGAKRAAGSESVQRDRARFVGLVADMVGRSLAMDRLTTWEGRLERFFAGPVVAKILRSGDLREIEPKVAVSTVLFFDIRGFSKRTEEKNELILQYIQELRRAFTAMTAIILEEQGVVLQYMGDGILACWNVPFMDPSHVDLAVRASLRMAEAFGRQTGGWRCGIGLHTGEVVAGAIGSEQVFSYGLLGSVVNQASRVEGITKALGVSILASGDVARQISPGTAEAVPVGRYRPAGMAAALELYELGPAPGDPGRLKAFQSAWAAFKVGDWSRAVGELSCLPPEDGPAAYLRSLAGKYKASPPPHWEGIIELSQK